MVVHSTDVSANRKQADQLSKLKFYNYYIIQLHNHIKWISDLYKKSYFICNTKIRSNFDINWLFSWTLQPSIFHFSSWKINSINLWNCKLNNFYVIRFTGLVNYWYIGLMKAYRKNKQKLYWFWVIEFKTCLKKSEVNFQCEIVSTYPSDSIACCSVW